MGTRNNKLNNIHTIETGDHTIQNVLPCINNVMPDIFNVTEMIIIFIVYLKMVKNVRSCIPMNYFYITVKQSAAH